MIIITGAAGFIGSCLISKLNELGFNDLILVDDFSKIEKNKNYENKNYTQLIERDSFIEWATENANQIQIILHIGARTDTTEFDVEILNKLNFEYTKQIWNLCVSEGLPFIYASSAATYGMGEYGFDDDESIISKLKPLNPYGQSKLDFDIWALAQENKPYFWAGLKFFNVYGPNEYHKNRMASVVFHAYNQIKSNGNLKLFKSHHIDYKDGEQKRDFVYVKDVLEVIIFLIHHRKNSGIYNLGSGVAHSFNQLAEAIFKAINKSKNIVYIDTPVDIRDKYQYYTCANMNKIRAIGFDKQFHSLENGVKDYIENYLLSNNHY